MDGQSSLHQVTHLSSHSPDDRLSLSLDLTNESVYTYFLDNQQTSTHQSLIFALRQFNGSSSNPPWVNERLAFTADYELRLYTSSCFHFDEGTEQWKPDGLKVGPETNHFQTQCLSTHI